LKRWNGGMGEGKRRKTEDSGSVVSRSVGQLARISHKRSQRDVKDAHGCKCFTRTTEADAGVLHVRRGV
jgi:hypothetical protein